MPSLPDSFVEFPQRDFPRLTHFGVVHNAPRNSVPLHSHAGFEIVYFIEGSGLLQVSAASRPVEIRQDGLLVTAPGFEHIFKLQGRAVSYYWLGFQTDRSIQFAGSSSIPPRTRARRRLDGPWLVEFDRHAVRLADATAGSGHLVLPQFSEAHEVFRRIADELDVGRAYARDLIHLRIIELFTLIDRRLAEGTGQRPGTAIERLRRYIEQNYDRRISLAVLAAEADLSSCYISRAFHRAFGMGPVSYTNRFRIGRARELLASGESVTRTAYRCGFDNPRYFSSVFRALTGLAPRAFARGTAEGAQNCRH